jgi:maleate isomerase
VRARVGLIIPSSNRLTEQHMRTHAPPGVEAHVTRLRMTGPHHVALNTLLPRIGEATQALTDAHCTVIVFHCTASSMEDGVAGERRVLEVMRQATDTLVATTASATLAAFEALQVRRIVLLSPYVESTHEAERAFLCEAGIATVGGRALGLSRGDEYLRITPTEWLRYGCEAVACADSADAVFLSCTNIHSLEVIEPLEAQIGRPVVASNQAVLWHALRRCGLEDIVPRLGGLMRI